VAGFDRVGATVRLRAAQRRELLTEPIRHEPIEIDAETSQGLLEAISAVFNDDGIPPGVPSAAGRLGVRQLMECAQLGAEQGGIEIRRSREEVV
jgi:hypothetical protein